MLGSSRWSSAGHQPPWATWLCLHPENYHSKLFVNLQKGTEWDLSSQLPADRRGVL